MEFAGGSDEHRDLGTVPDNLDLLHCIVDQAAIGIAVFSQDGRGLHVNLAFCTLTGYNREECADLSVELLVHQDARSELHRSLKAIADGKIGSCRFECRCLHASGRPLQGLVNLSKLDATDTSSFRYLFQLTDIGPQKRADERWNQILENSGQSAWELHVPTGVFSDSSQWTTVFGMPPDQRVHHDSVWKEKVHPDDLSRGEEAMDRVRLHGALELDIAYRFRSEPAGRWRWLVTRGKVSEFAPDGTALRMVGTTMDVTREKEMEEQLAAVKEQLEIALEAGGVGTFDVDFVNNVQHWDARNYELHGVKPDEFVPSMESLDALRHPDDLPEIKRIREAAFKDQSHYQLNYRVLLRDTNTVRHIRDSVRLIRAPDGTVLNAVGVCWDVTEDVERTQQLRGTLDLLQAVMNGTPDVIYVKDREGRYLLVNPALEKVVGRPSADIVGRDDTEVYPPEIARALIENDRHVMAGAEPYTFEEIAPVNGELHTYSSTKVPRRDERGHVIGLIGISYDLTEVKKAEAALRQSEARWQFAIDGARDGIWDWNVETGHVFYSHQWKAMLGYADEEVGDTTDEWSERVHPEDLPRCWAVVQEHLSGATPDFSLEHRMRAKDGSWRWIFDRGKVVERDEQGKPRRIIGTHTDITARKEEENSIRSLNQRLQLAIEAAQAGIFEFDFKTERYTADNRVYELYGITREETDHSMTGWLALLHPDDVPRVISEYKNATRETSAFNLDFRVIHPRTGEIRYIRALARVIRDDSGAPVRSVGMNWDVTEAVELRLQNVQLIEKLRLEMATAEAARREAESANRAKSKFLAAASHDLRQPIHAQGLFLEVLARTDLSPAQRDVLANALAACRASGEMLNTLLDFSRLEAGVVAANKRAFRLQPLLNKIAVELAPLADQKNIVYRMRETTAVVYSDPALLELILRNLISNAIRYTERGGVLIGCRKREQKLSVEIWDTGIGIATESRNTIFHEFHQLGNPERDRRKGLGLGLAITDRLVRTLGENLSLSSHVGRGSKFAITVPLAKKQSFHEPARTLNPSIGALDLRALVIEDDEAARLGMQFLLQSWGAYCEVAETIEEALAKAASHRPDVVICDYRLRDRRTGIEAIAALRQIYPELPAILVTGDTAPERLREGQTSGIPLLHKPVMPDKLYLKITDLLAARLT